MKNTQGFLLFLFLLYAVFVHSPKLVCSTVTPHRTARLVSRRPGRSFQRDKSRIKCEEAGQRAARSHSTGVELEEIPLSEAQFNYA